MPATSGPAGNGRPAETARRIEELGRIILAYSEVTERLEKSHDQLTQTVESLSKELGEKNRQLERKNRLAALGEMAAGLAHEIRNPLGGIQLYASILARDLSDRPDSLQVVQKISGGVKRLESLVGQVLQFTREIVANPRPMDLAAVVAQAVEFAGKTLEERNVVCRARGPASLSVAGDSLLLGQAVLNLVLNAAEAAEGGEVFVEYGKPTAGSEATQFRIEVRDTGPGIDPEILDRIFNPFFTTKESGTGLGLAIVHRIVEAHEGTIVASNQEGGGARFEVRV
ncbi:MAG TPA: ATP-binding protein [Tepidisphaeraceae bacterium]|nr:ATP-binding protein [Tepidisphaeraceae bacterium]